MFKFLKRKEKDDLLARRVSRLINSLGSKDTELGVTSMVTCNSVIDYLEENYPEIRMTMKRHYPKDDK